MLRGRLYQSPGAAAEKGLITDYRVTPSVRCDNGSQGCQVPETFPVHSKTLLERIEN